jgi:hypothetical protein
MALHPSVKTTSKGAPTMTIESDYIGPDGEPITATSVAARLSAEQQARIDQMIRERLATWGEQ